MTLVRFTSKTRNGATARLAIEMSKWCQSVGMIHEVDYRWTFINDILTFEFQDDGHAVQFRMVWA